MSSLNRTVYSLLWIMGELAWEGLKEPGGSWGSWGILGNPGGSWGIMWDPGGFWVILFSPRVLKLLGGGSVINGAYAV